MSRKKVTVVGAGNVGATLAQALAQTNLVDVTLIDIPETKGMPAGKALDILEASPIYEYDSLVTGGTESIGSSPEMLPTDGVLQVASFAAGRHLAFVVSDLSADDTSRFADAMVGPVAQRLNA